MHYITDGTRKAKIMFKVNTVVYEINTAGSISHLKVGGSLKNLPCGSRSFECSFLPFAIL